MRRRSWLLGLFYLLAAVLPLTAVARVCLPAAAMVARDLPAPQPRPPIVILAVETASGPAVLVVETASGRALLAVETAAGPRLFWLKTASGIPLSCAKTAAEYGVDWYAYPTDPVNQWDPMGLWSDDAGLAARQKQFARAHGWTREELDPPSPDPVEFRSGAGRLLGKEYFSLRTEEQALHWADLDQLQDAALAELYKTTNGGVLSRDDDAMWALYSEIIEHKTTAERRHDLLVKKCKQMQAMPEDYFGEIITDFLPGKGTVRGSSYALFGKWKEAAYAAGPDLALFVAGMVVQRGMVRAATAANKGRGLWKLTSEGADKIMRHETFGKFFRSKSDGLWWVEDTAGHGPSAFKVYRETGKGLEWYRDADQFGDFIINKHKSDVGTFISWKELAGAK